MTRRLTMENVDGERMAALDSDIAREECLADKLARSPEFFPELKPLKKAWENFDCCVIPENARNDRYSALFYNLERFFAQAWKWILVAAPKRLEFERWGLDPWKKIAPLISDGSNVERETIYFSTDTDDKFAIAAPARTCQILFDSLLGYEPEALCQGVTEDRDFFTDALTPLEREVLRPDLIRLAALYPSGFEIREGEIVAPSEESGRQWITVWTKEEEPENKLGLDDDIFYWERRSFVFADQVFPWTILIPAKILFGEKKTCNREQIVESPAPKEPVCEERTAPQATLSPKFRSNEVETKTISVTAIRDSRTDSNEPRQKLPNDKKGTEGEGRKPVAKKCLQGTLDEFDKNGDKTALFTVEIGCGEMSPEEWKALKPGAILKTNLPVKELFVGVVDGRPRFLVKPGVYRGTPAAQIKSFLQSSINEGDDKMEGE